MWFDRSQDEKGEAARKRIERLESYHLRHYGWFLLSLLVGVVLFVAWAMVFRIDEVARAQGEVIASSRVQIIQAVDGGVLSKLLIKEGDKVVPGQILAELDQTRVGATVGETEARLFALKAKAARLRAEVTEAAEPVFPQDKHEAFQELLHVEAALFRQRRIGLQEELRTLQVAVDLAGKEVRLVEQLLKSGDVSDSEVLRVERNLNEAEAKLISRRNKFFEDARIDLAKAEDEIGQNEQILTRRQQEQRDSVFVAQTDGIVKNIRVTTVGGVLRAGEEIMEIVPLDDALIVEAKVSPADIAQVRPGLDASIRLDPFDYTIFGSVPAKVIYVSADTLKEDTPKGEEIYYRVHVSPLTTPIRTTAHKLLEMLPGMTARIDIRTGDRSLMDVLLKPLRKTLSEALRER